MTSREGRKPEAEGVRSVIRALGILRVMNSQPIWTLHELHAATQLPKSTLSRLLATFVDQGYVRWEDRAGTYRLTSKVGELSDGYTEGSRIVDAAREILLKATRNIKWPLALGLLDWDAIVVRFSSMPYSPLAITTTTLGQRLSLLDTAMGRCYLAWCSDVEWQSITRHALNLQAADADFWTHLAQDKLIIRQVGYAVRQSNAPHSSATLSMPLIVNGSAIAVLGMTTFGRAMGQATIDKHVPVIAEVAGRIVDVLSRDQAFDPARR